ncbi:hypothetical protein LCGC14_1383110 [marine sediment metagenome]|uniref:Lipoprotein n=2 Tax=root TaxID=1 RepID=A0A831QPG0_9FLAO|nr:hypothetical protein [Pricia sp.]HEA20921.1 hypothetical protein [Pricia antarctica]
MKSKKMKFSITLLLLMITLGACEKNSDNDSFDPCQIEPFPTDPNIVESGISVRPINESDRKGYLITGTFSNNSDENIRGTPNFVLNLNGEIKTYGNNTSNKSACTTIDAKSSCDFETFYRVTEDDVKIDLNVNLRCFYYLPQFYLGPNANSIKIGLNY